MNLRSLDISFLEKGELKTLTKARALERGGLFPSIYQVWECFLKIITFGLYRTVDQKLDRILKHAYARSTLSPQWERLLEKLQCQEMKTQVIEHHKEFAEELFDLFKKEKIDILAYLKSKFKVACHWNSKEHGLHVMATEGLSKKLHQWHAQISDQVETRIQSAHLFKKALEKLRPIEELCEDWRKMLSYARIRFPGLLQFNQQEIEQLDKDLSEIRHDYFQAAAQESWKPCDQTNAKTFTQLFALLENKYNLKFKELP